MDMENDNDDLLNRFLSQVSQTEIADNGFSDRVMGRIEPISEKRMKRLSWLWTAVCTVSGIVMLVRSGMVSATLHTAAQTAAHMAKWAGSMMQPHFLLNIVPVILSMPLAMALVAVVMCVAANRKMA